MDLDQNIDLILIDYDILSLSISLHICFSMGAMQNASNKLRYTIFVADFNYINRSILIISILLFFNGYCYKMQTDPIHRDL